MTLQERLDAMDWYEAGVWMHDRVTEWYPLCRSITGDGVRETLRRMGKHVAIDAHEAPTGEAVFDWTIPREWNIRDAYIKDTSGNRVVDFQKHNLHVLNYSVPVHEHMELEALKAHCFTLPDQPDAIPYRTSYFKEQWGFCLSQRQLAALEPGTYEVCIDSTLEPGHLTYGECVLPGRTDDTILVSAHVCHPSLANDNLSGLALAVCAAKFLCELDLRHTVRFVFAPGTIGAITWLARNEVIAEHIRHGLILACVGDGGASSYKQSRRGDAEVDRAVEYVFEQSKEPFAIHPFSPYGYDERQYCSPGFNLPVGCFMRSGPGGYPEYHTSGDNPDLVQPAALADSLRKFLATIEILEGNATYRNLNPKCEPQLGRRGLYDAVGGRSDAKELQMALLWVLNYSDGANSLLDIARRAGMPFRLVRQAADALLDADLLAEV